MRKFLFVLLLIPLQFFSQSDTNFGWLPKINLSSRIASEIKWVNSIEVREVLFDEEYQFTHNLLDVSSIVSFKTNLNQSFNIGYIVRFDKKETVHRFVQQYNFIGNINSLKLAHRLGFEQHFPSKSKSFYRARYRATLQKPLNGEKVDVKEFYVKLGNEYVYNFTDENLEIRVSPYLGYRLSEKDKLEFGLEYRGSSLVDEFNKHRLWLRTTWYISL
ncbi:DUF2490 domain-containing protein [Tenacibaculum sp. IB213877]|uniref:DUF2490 domain-containing protein n=1 Tax=Tenacibaculum sp. IB213877 TaxID=3097351 RepID=UPI002A5AB156|nr:DUF2490 domain-containing protein [Tenacibaculum sp. IB213877]MDY0780764.1 DUF2490 domain-containing protein [Tenacibaculum sp. IB213877]